MLPKGDGVRFIYLSVKMHSVKASDVNDRLLKLAHRLMDTQNITPPRENFGVTLLFTFADELILRSSCPCELKIENPKYRIGFENPQNEPIKKRCMSSESSPIAANLHQPSILDIWPPVSRTTEGSTDAIFSPHSLSLSSNLTP